MDETLAIIGVLAVISVWFTGWAQEVRERDGNRMPERAAQIFGTILCAELFYLVATVEHMFGCGSWHGCDSQGVYWAGLQQVMASIPVTPDLVFWVILVSNLLFFLAMAKADKEARKSQGSAS